MVFRDKKQGPDRSPDELSRRILTHLARTDYRPARLRALARQMGIGDEAYGRFRSAVKALARSGRVVIGSGSAVMPPQEADRVVGTFRGNPRGFGFVVPEEPGAHGDLYVPEAYTADAITGDTVQARAVKKGKRGGKFIYEGRIVQVLQRGHRRFVGQLERREGLWLVRPDGQILHAPIVVGDATAREAREGDQVVMEILTYPSPGQPARGVIVETLGPRGDPGVDTLSIIRQHHIPDTFPEECLEQARGVADAFDLRTALPGREDLRDLPVVTIDPPDARDFDDAVSLTRENGAWTLGVHIADVAAFVADGSPLDEQARRRGNSVYLPRRVIPMLPELLSNGLCSLQEGEPRLTKSVFIRYDDQGRVLGTRFANSVIRSRQRLTYQQATLILEGKTGGFDGDVVAMLNDCDALARRIQRRRLAAGMLTLDLPEVELVYDDHGKVTDAHPADDSFSHTLIEMFMVEANEAVARLLDEAGVPFLRRVHPEPDPAAGANLASFLKMTGHQLPRAPRRQDLRRVLEQVKGRPESYAVNLAVLRSLQRAEYSPHRLGHYALASDHYLHFTSPIRRYPDLTVHRLLDEHLKGRLTSARRKGERPKAEGLEQLGEHCSFTERRAEDAEKELITVKVLELLSRHVGESFEGVITGVTTFGLFVQLTRYLVDGLVRFEDLPDDWWELDTRAGCVVGQRSGRRIGLGDGVCVRVARVEVPARRLDLVLEGHAGRVGPARKPTRAASREQTRVRKRARRG